MFALWERCGLGGGSVFFVVHFLPSLRPFFFIVSHPTARNEGFIVLDSSDENKKPQGNGNVFRRVRSVHFPFRWRGVLALLFCFLYGFYFACLISPFPITMALKRHRIFRFQTRPFSITFVSELARRGRNGSERVVISLAVKRKMTSLTALVLPR